MLFFAISTSAQNAWINEFHYDNASTDVGEFVEVVIEDAGTYTLSDFQIDLYNGNGGSSYNTKTLDAFTVGSTSGNFTFYTYTYPSNGIQNGAPDGIALSYQEVLISGQFLSYEGTLTGSSGPASGILSVDIGVSETSGTPVGHSLQLAGAGTQYSDFSWQAPATETPGNLNNSQSFGGSVFPVAINAYTVSTTEIDVLYNLDITSVDPSEYELTGSSTIYFLDAEIDISNPKLVHLSNATVPITADLTLDSIADATNSTGKTFYGGIMPIAFTNTNNPGGTMLDGYTATFQGIVSANDGYNNIWLSDMAGQYNGVLVFDFDLDGLVNVGDEILLAAERSPYNNITEIVDPTLVTVLSTGNTPYGPDIIPGTDIEENISVDTNPAEAWEGQLVTIEDFTVEFYANYDYKCSWDDGSDAIYYFHVGDNVDYHYGTTSLLVGSSYSSITGVVDWSSDSSFYRINPRGPADIVFSANPAVQLAIVSVNNGSDPYVGANFDVVVQTQDISGVPAAVSGDVNFTFTTDGGDLGTVTFVSGTTNTGTITDGLYEVIVSGVQMAPEGTNVTITANDDLSVLTPGTSDPFDVIELVIPDLIITEIMNNPSAVWDSDGEWFEIYNNGDDPVDLTGWLITDSVSNYHTITGPLTIPAYSFAVLGNNSDGGTNGGYTCDYQYASTFNLGNSSDKIILVMPDGVTEVDRVAWDNGATFPDPSGKSMSFAGFVTDDNNNGDLWVYTSFREATFTGTDGDKGSPGSNGYDQIIEGGFKLDLKVYLESPFVSADSMSNYFRAGGYLSMVQPFDPPLPYYGNGSPAWLSVTSYDTLTYIPYLTTDWLLIELRDATSAAAATSGTMVDQIPALLTDTGTVVAMNGKSPLLVKTDFTYGMYIVIWSINHLGVMSSSGMSPVTETTMSYDFSIHPGQVYGGDAGYKDLGGVWGLMSGDVNGDQTIDNNDLVDGWDTEAAEEGGYQGSNLFIDNQIDNKDKNDYWLPNNGASSTVPN